MIHHSRPLCNLFVHQAIPIIPVYFSRRQARLCNGFDRASRLLVDLDVSLESGVRSITAGASSNLPSRVRAVTSISAPSFVSFLPPIIERNSALLPPLIHQRDPLPPVPAVTNANPSPGTRWRKLFEAGQRAQVRPRNAQSLVLLNLPD